MKLKLLLKTTPIELYNNLCGLVLVAELLHSTYTKTEKMSLFNEDFGSLKALFVLNPEP